MFTQFSTIFFNSLVPRIELKNNVRVGKRYASVVEIVSSAPYPAVSETRGVVWWSSLYRGLKLFSVSVSTVFTKIIQCLLDSSNTSVFVPSSGRIMYSVSANC